MIFLSLVGLVDATYLTIQKLQGVIPPCNIGSDCGAVLSSPWAQIGPIPVSAFGVVFYAVVLLLAALQLVEWNPKKLFTSLFAKLGLSKNHPFMHISLSELLLLITFCGAIISTFLVFLMAVVIKSFCPYCFLSAGVSYGLFLIVTWESLRTTKPSSFGLRFIWFTLFGTIYSRIIKPFFFLFDAELIHNTMTKSGKFLGRSSTTQKLTEVAFSFKHPSLHSTFDGISFPNRIGLPAGFDYNGDLTQILPSVGFGWHTIGTVTLEPYGGNPKPRLGRFPNSKALLVNKGLKSLGTRKVIQDMSQLSFQIPTAISIASTNKLFESEKAQLLDIVTSFRLFEQSSVKHQLYELNISCPNTFGGEPYTTCLRLETLMDAMDKLKLSKPLYVKMPIDQSETETKELLSVLNNHNVQGIIFGNLTKDRNNPLVAEADRLEWQKRKGNLSGKPTWERSNNLIALTKKQYKDRFTIVGTGGIFTAEDAQHKLDLGADLLQLITGMIFGGPQTVGAINLGLALKTTSPSE